MTITCSELHETVMVLAKPTRDELSQLTKPYRDKCKCPICGNHKNIETAHYHESDLRKRIALTLTANHRHESGYEFEIKTAINNCIMEHYPFYKKLIFLCKNCHNDYDYKKDASVIRKIGILRRKALEYPKKITFGDRSIATERESSSTRKHLSNVMKTLFSTINQSDLMLLHNPVFCRNVFQLGYPMLTKDKSKTQDAHGHMRYYKKPLKEGYLCKEWKKQNLILLSRYLNELSAKYS